MLHAKVKYLKSAANLRKKVKSKKPEVKNFRNDAKMLE